MLPAVTLPKQSPPLAMDKSAKEGFPLYISGVLVDAKGAPAAGKEVQFNWEKGKTTVKSSDQGTLRLKLSNANTRRSLYRGRPRRSENLARS